MLSTVSTIPIDETFRYFKFIFGINYLKTFTSIIFGTIAFSKSEGGGKEIGKKSAMTSGSNCGVHAASAITETDLDGRFSCGHARGPVVAGSRKSR